jgi:hypothetical protein
MRTSNHDFFWIDSSRGFAWQDAGKEAWHAAQGANVPRRLRAEARSYSVRREDSGLFLKLADTVADERGIRDFLTSWQDRSQRRPAPTVASPSSPHTTVTEQQSLKPPWADWIDAARWMRLLVDLWRTVQLKNRNGLARHIRWIEASANGPRVIYECRSSDYPDALLPPNGVHELIASDTVRPDVFMVLKPKDVCAAALVYLQMKANARLVDAVTPHMLFEVKTSRLRLEQIPKTFLAFLWLQFAQAVAQNKSYGRCLSCGIWFERSPETGRTHRRFCSNACRTWMHRRRQQQAQQWHAEGVAVRAIAKKLETDVRTVKGWLADFGAEPA